MAAGDSIRLIVKEGPNPGTVFELKERETTLGRREGNDVVVAFPAVSGQHARITIEGSFYFLEDLNSSNGTFLNGQRISELTQMKAGDEIRLGHSVVLTFEAPRPVVPDPSHTMLEMAPDATMLEQKRPEVTILEQKQPDKAVAAPAEAEETLDLEKQAAIAKQVEVARKKMEEKEKTAVPTPPAPSGKSASAAETQLFQDYRAQLAQKPPQLIVTVAGEAPITHTVVGNSVTIGRANDNDIVIASKVVSRYHARLMKEGDGYMLVVLPEASNPVLHEGRPLSQPQHLSHGDKLRIGGLDPGLMVTLAYISPAEASLEGESKSINFGGKTIITIGRDPENDVVLDSPNVSRFHAQIERVGQRYRVSDLRSSNGTFVNGQEIEEAVWLQPDDAVRIGTYRFVMGQDELAQFDESKGLRVEAIGLNKWVRKDLNILQDISLVFQPREFVVVVGQSGGGKSTLVDSIAGYRPATDGKVLVNDLNVYENFDAIRNNIGFVPQKDIIHMELTVFQALDYAAQLRMPSDTTKEERHKRIEEVLSDLDLAHRRDVQISGLSGGQQKRVSIGVELLTKPGLFFLDEPTSGLDPGTETALMQLMRRLADQGRTIVLITHATKNVMLADKVVFLARGGYLAWFGPPDEALAYFDQHRSERERRARDIEFDEIYSILDDRSKGGAQDWAQRYRAHAAYRKYVEEPLREKDLAPQSTGQTTVAAAAGAKRKKQVGGLRQFLILSSRNLKILTRDRFSLGLMLAAPPLVSLLDVVLSQVLNAAPFDFFTGKVPEVMITLFLLSVYGVMVGGLAQMREIVKEQDIYKRERLVNLRLFPYILSKVWVAALLAVYGAVVYTVVHYLVFEMPGGATEFTYILVSLMLATMAGMMLGLFASAMAPNANSAPLIVVLLMLPQIVLGGALVPLPPAVTTPISTRWAFQAFMATTGPGSDVARDACWTTLTQEQQEALTVEQKNANCNCMGTNALRANSCNYPGLGVFYTEAVDAPQPEPLTEAPPEKPVEPAEPAIPPQPVEPTDQSDLVAQGEFREELKAWQEEVEAIQAGYKADLEVYRAELAVFEAEVGAYQERFANREKERGLWQAEQAAAILPAEALIRQFYEGYGWTFVDKNNPDVYPGTVYQTWVAQSVIILVLFGLIVVLQKRKDVV